MIRISILGSDMIRISILDSDMIRISILIGHIRISMLDSASSWDVFPGRTWTAMCENGRGTTKKNWNSSRIGV
jgi:hypothetical protein